MLRVNRFFYSLAGILVGLHVPLYWLLWRAYAAKQTVLLPWFRKEWAQQYPIYICSGIIAVVLFAVVGYVLGKWSDEQVTESLSVLDSNFELSQLASTDGLTGLFNTRYTHERLDLEIEQSFRSTLACLIIDIDHFKKINDKYGHPFGDEVLIGVASILKKAVRRVDGVGRLGGEEFLVILPDTPPDRALLVGERIRKAVEAQPFHPDGKTIHVTISVGVATYPAPELQSKAQFLKAADDALYTAKRKGRNRVVAWTDHAQASQAA